MLVRVLFLYKALHLLEGLSSSSSVWLSGFVGQQKTTYVDKLGQTLHDSHGTSQCSSQNSLALALLQITPSTLVSDCFGVSAWDGNRPWPGPNLELRLSLDGLDGPKHFEFLNPGLNFRQLLELLDKQLCSHKNLTTSTVIPNFV